MCRALLGQRCSLHRKKLGHFTPGPTCVGDKAEIHTQTSTCSPWILTTDLEFACTTQCMVLFCFFKHRKNNRVLTFPLCFGGLFSAVGTFARALDCSSSVRQPSLHMSAAAASRDITLVRCFLKFRGYYFLCYFSFKASIACCRWERFLVEELSGSSPC